MKKGRDFYIRDYVPVFIGIIIFCVLGCALFVVIKYQNPTKPLEVQDEGVNAKFKEKKVDISSSTCPKVDLADLKEEADNIELTYAFHEVKTGEMVEYDSSLEQDLVEETQLIPNIYIANLNDKFYITLETSQYDDSYKKFTMNDVGDDGFAIYAGLYSEKSLIYTVKVYINIENCKDVLIRKFTIQLPVYNKYQNQAKCSYYPDFKYCAEYLMEDLPSYNTVEFEYAKYLKDIERGKITTRSTTNIMEALANVDPNIKEEVEEELKKEEKENSNVVNSIKNNKEYYFIGGAVVIFLVIIGYLYIAKKRRKQR